MVDPLSMQQAWMYLFDLNRDGITHIFKGKAICMYFVDPDIKLKMFNSYYCVSFIPDFKASAFGMHFISRNFIKMSFYTGLEIL